MRALSLLAVAGCAAVLGGLDEGHRLEPTPDAGSDSSVDLREDGGSCERPWLDGYSYRANFEISARFTTPLTDYALPILLDTHRLIALGRLRKDGRDLHITADDGTTRLRFAFASDVDSEAAKIWIRLDVPGGTSHLYAYYGGPAGDDDGGATIDEIFTRGILPNPHFEADGGGWVARGGDTTMFALGDGGAYVAAESTGGPALLMGWCAAATFPEGHDWEVVFDLTPATRPARTRFMVYRSSGEPLFGTDVLQPQRDLQAAGQALEPGFDEVCFGIARGPEAEPGIVAGTFANPRIRPRSLVVPSVTLLAHEDVTCNR